MDLKREHHTILSMSERAEETKALNIAYRVPEP